MLRDIAVDIFVVMGLFGCVFMTFSLWLSVAKLFKKKMLGDNCKYDIGSDNDKRDSF